MDGLNSNSCPLFITFVPYATDLTLPFHSCHLCRVEIISLIGLLWELNEIIHLQRLQHCLTLKKHQINVPDDYNHMDSRIQQCRDFCLRQGWIQRLKWYPLSPLLSLCWLRSQAVSSQQKCSLRNSNENVCLANIPRHESPCLYAVSNAEQSLHQRECRADWPSLGWLGWERPSSPKYGCGQRGWEGSVSLRKTRMSLLREEWMETGQRKQQMATCPRFIASVLGKHLFNH